MSCDNTLDFKREIVSIFPAHFAEHIMHIFLHSLMLSLPTLYPSAHEASSALSTGLVCVHWPKARSSACLLSLPALMKKSLTNGRTIFLHAMTPVRKLVHFENIPNKCIRCHRVLFSKLSNSIIRAMAFSLRVVYLNAASTKASSYHSESQFLCRADFRKIGSLQHSADTAQALVMEVKTTGFRVLLSNPAKFSKLNHRLILESWGYSTVSVLLRNVSLSYVPFPCLPWILISPAHLIAFHALLVVPKALMLGYIISEQYNISQIVLCNSHVFLQFSY